MKFRHQFQVSAPIQRVAEFHAQSDSMAAITPPPVVVKMRHTPPVLAGGDEMEFTLWLGPLPIHWLARIEDVSPTGFSDLQLRGPFAEWEHRHIFVAITDQTTEVIDEITLRLRLHTLWWPIGLGMRLSLPFLFAYRAWKTKRMLS